MNIAIRRSAFAIGFLALLMAGPRNERAFCQGPEVTPAINTSRAVDEGVFVKIGGIDQWLQMRGDNDRNPVLLILHGGPGFSYGGFAEVFRTWEKHFTVVQWDQRGAGRTYGRNGSAGSGTMTIDRMTQDGIEVTEFVRKRFNKRKVLLLAHSWGTVLGLPMIVRRPDLFYAYVGTGQIINMARNETTSYDLVLARVQTIGDPKAIKALEQIGRPPYKDFKTWMIKGRMVVAYAPPSASARSLPNAFTSEVIAGFNFSSNMLYNELMAYDAGRLGRGFKIPIFIFQGDSDIQAPTSLAKDFLSSVKAPKKKLVLLKGEGHTALLTVPDTFLKELVNLVRPLQ